MSWNPNSPATAGLEWQPVRSGVTYLDASSKVSLARFTASATVSVSSIEAYLRDLVDDALIGCEVYAAGNELSDAEQMTVVLPRTNTGKIVSADWYDAGAGAVDNFDVDDATTDVDGAWNQSTSTTVAKLGFRMGAGGPSSWAGSRILRVDIFARWTYAGGTGVNGWAALEDPSSPGTFVQVGDNAYPPLGNAYRSDRIAKLDVNPFTGLPWTSDDVDAYFATGSTLAAGIIMSWNTLPNAVKVSAIWARVHYCTENRLAAGYIRTEDTPGNGWKSFTMLQPDGSGVFDKVNGSDYSIAFRRVSGTGRAGWPWLAGAAYPPHAGYAGFDAAAVEQWGRITDLGAMKNRIRPVRMIVSGSDTSDSQPYAVLTAVAVNGTIVAAEKFTAPASSSFGFVRAVIRPAAASTAALPDLVVRLVRNSDNAVLSSTTVTRADIDALADAGNGWKLLGVNLTPVSLTSSTVYRVEFLATGATGVEQYEVAWVDTVGKGSASMGGTSNVGRWLGSDVSGADLAATVATVPSTPSSFAVALH